MAVLSFMLGLVTVVAGVTAPASAAASAPALVSGVIAAHGDDLRRRRQLGAEHRAIHTHVYDVAGAERDLERGRTLIICQHLHRVHIRALEELGCEGCRLLR